MLIALFYPIVKDVEIPLWNGVNSYAVEIGIISKKHPAKAILDLSHFDILL
jgi:hypothetical protein